MGTDQAPPFGELLRRRRVEARLTQEALAERAHLSARTISDLERGVNRAPQRENLQALAAALDLSPAERAEWEAARQAQLTRTPAAKPPPRPVPTGDPGAEPGAMPSADPGAMPSAIPEVVAARRLRGWAAGRPGRLGLAAGVVFAVGVALLVGVSLATATALPAPLERLLCAGPVFPVLGLPCEPPALVAVEPVSVTRDEATLTVLYLASAGDETTVRLEINGLPNVARQQLARLTRVLLRDSAGKEYALRRTVQGGGGRYGAGATLTFSGEWAFAALDAPVRDVEVVVDGPPPIETWHARVPVVPDQQAPAGQRPLSNATTRGITTRVTGVSADRERTAIQLAAETAPPARHVQSLGGPFQGRHLVLRDERGQEYDELPYAGRSRPSGRRVYTENLLFPPLAAEARMAELILPVVHVEEETGAAVLTVPLGSQRAGERRPPTELQLGRYPVRVTETQLSGERRQRQLRIALELGAWQDGRLLIAPERIEVAGVSAPVYDPRVSDDPGLAGQWAELILAVPDNSETDLTITFRNARVAVEGPWHLQVPLGGRR
jgi:transcriptional regulator with XRE-family HTH domain